MEEEGSEETSEALTQAEVVGTSIVTRAEVPAAFAKAVRTGALTEDEATTVLEAFRTDWPDLIRVELSEVVAARADTLAWDHQLRGYDAVQLASAQYWNDALGESITLATYDQVLRQAARRINLSVFPGS